MTVTIKKCEVNDVHNETEHAVLYVNLRIIVIIVEFDHEYCFADNANIFSVITEDVYIQPMFFI